MEEMTENPYKSPKSNGMTAIDRSTWPAHVRFGLWGLKTRASAWAFVVLSIVLAVGSVLYGFVNPFFFAGGLLVFSALWYYLAIRWVDQHSHWG